MAPLTGRLSPADRGVVLDGIARGMNIVSGLHEYLSEDAEIAAEALGRNVRIRDIRKPKPSKDRRLFDGSVAGVDALASPFSGPIAPSESGQRRPFWRGL